MFYLNFALWNAYYEASIETWEQLRSQVSLTREADHKTCTSLNSKSRNEWDNQRDNHLMSKSESAMIWGTGNWKTLLLAVILLGGSAGVQSVQSAGSDSQELLISHYYY